MKDEKDTNTKDIFPDTEAGEQEKIKFLKGKNKPFQILHIEKIMKGGTKKTTVSIETLSYQFLSLKLGAIPHTREANENIKNWIIDEMKQGLKTGVYNPETPFLFSKWLKRRIVNFLIDEKTKKQWFDFLDMTET